MDENSELEEGEACSHNDDEDKNVGPDIAFSYIDEKIQNVLGHFQKDFEGCVSMENLGAKFGIYGSFLPTCERSPHPKTPHKSFNTPKSPNKFPVEGASQRLQAPSSAPTSTKHNGNSLNNSGVITKEISSRQDPVFSSSLSAQKSDLKDGKSGPRLEQRSLKLRIKVGSDSVSRKSAAIYSGLGLDNSPSSSLGNSTDGCGGVQPLLQDTAHDSPTSILQVMTTFPVPGDFLLSPLHDSLLCLIGKQILLLDSKSRPYRKDAQGHSAAFTNGSVSALSDKKVSKNKDKKLQRKSERAVGSKQGHDAEFEDGTEFSVKKNLENDSTEVKVILPGNFKSMPLANMVSNSVSIKASKTASEVVKKGNSNPVKDILLSSTLLDSLELISVQDSGKNEKHNAESGSFVKVLEHAAASIGDHVAEPSGNGCHKSNGFFEPSKPHSSTIESIEDFNVGLTAPTKLKISQQIMLHIQDKATLSSDEEKPLAEGKKNLQGVESKEKVAVISTKQKLNVGVSVVSKNAMNTVDGVSTSRHKMLKLKSHNGRKFKDNHKDSAEGKSEQTNKQLCYPEKASGDRPMDPGFDDSQVKQNAHFVKSKESFGGQSFDENLTLTSVKDAVHVGSHVTENALEAEEYWVCCDNCENWRLLPFEIKPDGLPQKWLCSMQYWFPGMNRCDFSEEETTKAFRALRHLSSASGQIKTQSVANGTSSGVTTANVQHFDQNQKTVNFHDESSRRRKKHCIKDIEKASSRCALVQTSNSTKNQVKEPVKSRNVSDVNQLYADSNVRRRHSFDNLRKSCSHDHKDNHMNEAAETEKVKMKTKREVNHHGFGTVNKKNKTENISYDNKCWDADMDLGNVDAKSRSGFSAKASGKNVWKSNEYSLADDVKSDAKERLPASLVKLGEQTQLSSDGGSLDTRPGNETSMKKRKSDWLGNQNGHVSNIHAESGAIGLKREKKFRVSKSFAKESSRKDSNDISKRKSSVAYNLTTGSKVQPVEGIEVARTIGKDGQSWKPRNEFTSEGLDGSDSLRKDLGFGSGQFSALATSSSSKVSGSFKIRVCDNVKASPVESVSSSPLRTPLEGPTLAGMDILGKDNTTISGLSFLGEPRGCWDVGGENKINQSGIAKKEKVCGGSDPEPLDYRDRDADHKYDGRIKSYLVKCDTEVKEHNRFPSVSLVMMGFYDEDRMDKRQHENVLPRKSENGSSLQLKDNERTLMLDLDRDKMKASGHVSEQGDFSSKKNARHNSEVDPKSLTSVEKKLNAKQSVPDKSTIKSSEYEKHHAIKSDSIGHCFKDNRMENQLKLEECSDSDVNKSNATKEESKRDTPNLRSHVEDGDKQDCQNHESMKGSQMGGTFDGCSAHASWTGDASRAGRSPGNIALKNEPHQDSEHCVSELKVAKDLYDRSPGKISTSSLTAAHILKEAKELRDYADFLKSSGFCFESNESYFQAAMKYLSGASLLEICNSESAKQGEMSQMQVYSITAKLCEGCAQEYERHHELAAAALAYKCMEVAYWRLVFCKNSSSSKDRNDLQTSLQMIPQGESPSSSASDVDNLNNQASIDKTTLFKASVSHVAGNPAIVARNHSNFLRLLDFTQDVNCAVEASRKSQNAFLAANCFFDEAQQKECVTSVKKVIDFSFHDVDELIHLVRLAMEAINHDILSGARD